MRLIIDIDEKEFENASTLPWLFELKQKVQSMIPIPDNATNGDMFRVFFPNGIEMQDLKNTTERWWNTPYQKGGK